MLSSSQNFDFNKLMEEFDRENKRELQQYSEMLSETTDAQNQFLQTISSNTKLPTFEEQFARDLALDEEVERAYFANVLSTEEVQQQIETWICEHRLPTFEEQFSIELELERQAEQAWMDSIPTLEEVEASCQEFVKRSSKWHNLVRAKNANILLHIVDFNYSEKNYRKLLDIPEFADEQYIPVRTPDDESLLAIDLDFSLKDLVKLNTANVFIKIAQTKKFTLETPAKSPVEDVHCSVKYNFLLGKAS